MENQFGRVSSLRLAAGEKAGKTILEDLYFTAPFKVMSPFEGQKGGLRVMLLTASAGVMAGDRQEFDFHIKTGASLEFLSQSYEKIHKMQEGCARRESRVTVEKGGGFAFHPLPVIPFRDSAFENKMDIFLEDDTSRFSLREILSCGRAASGEKFAYRRYHSLVQIYRGERLIYRDNVRYEPDSTGMQGFGMYEGYTHQANLVYCGLGKDKAWAEKVRAVFEQEADAEGGATALASGDYAVKILGRQAQKLEALCDLIDNL